MDGLEGIEARGNANSHGRHDELEDLHSLSRCLCMHTLHKHKARSYKARKFVQELAGAAILGYPVSVQVEPTFEGTEAIEQGDAFSEGASLCCARNLKLEPRPDEAGPSHHIFPT